MYINRNVVFHENIFPFAQSRPNSEHLNLFVDHVMPRPIESISMLSSHQKLLTSSSLEPIYANQNQALQPASRPLCITKCPAYLSDYRCYLATKFFSTYLVSLLQLFYIPYLIS